jgi:hypothetical protein
MVPGVALAFLLVAPEPAAASAPLAIETASDDPDERAIAERVRRVIEEQRLEPWLFTRRIRIDRTAPIPHSHPVLTLNTDFRTDDEVLSSLIHEQFHWFLLRDQKALGAAVRELKARYPDAPAGPPRGARDLNSTYLHLLVCSLGADAVEDEPLHVDLPHRRRRPEGAEGDPRPTRLRTAVGRASGGRLSRPSSPAAPTGRTAPR